MINPGEILEVLCSDPEVHQDLCKVLPAASYDLISMEALEDDQVSYRLRLVKKKLEDQTKETGINDLFS